MLLVIGVLAVVAAIGMSMYRSRARLSHDKLHAARARWQAAGVRDYDIQVTVSGRTSGQYKIQVRNGKITQAYQNDQPFENLDRALPWTVPELFNYLEQDLANDSRPESPRAVTRVHFDATDGHLIRYVRASGQQQTAIDVELRRLDR